MNPTDVIENACTAIAASNVSGADELIRDHYPHAPTPRSSRSYTERQMTNVFRRDGFIDRYSGKRLVYPPVLRVLSAMLPDAFPYQSSWKTDECHDAYWRLFPTIDHVIPVSRGGADDESNWVTTSMMRNSAKSNWALDDLGWELHPVGDLDEWDGLMAWLLDFEVAQPDMIASSKYLSRWHRAAVIAKP